MNKLAIGGATAFVAIGMLGTLGSCMADAPKTEVKKAPPAVVTEQPATPAPTTTAPAPKTEAPAPSGSPIADGMYVVGTDFPAGRYRSPGALASDIPFCTATIKDPDGTIDGMELSNAVDQSIMFTVKDGQTVAIEGCQPFLSLR